VPLERYPVIGASPLALVGCFSSFFGLLIAFTIYMRLLKVWGSLRAGSYAFVSPVIAVVLGAAIYREHVGVFDVVGMMIMLVAAC
jgi:drug/metabolite transporter (DMT)-like permease